MRIDSLCPSENIGVWCIMYHTLIYSNSVQKMSLESMIYPVFYKQENILNKNRLV